MTPQALCFKLVTGFLPLQSRGKIRPAKPHPPGRNGLGHQRGDHADDSGKRSGQTVDLSRLMHDHGVTVEAAKQACGYADLCYSAEK